MSSIAFNKLQHQLDSRYDERLDVSVKRFKTGLIDGCITLFPVPSNLGNGRTIEEHNESSRIRTKKALESLKFSAIPVEAEVGGNEKASKIYEGLFYGMVRSVDFKYLLYKQARPINKKKLKKDLFNEIGIVKKLGDRSTDNTVAINWRDYRLARLRGSIQDLENKRCVKLFKSVNEISHKFSRFLLTKIFSDDQSNQIKLFIEHSNSLNNLIKSTEDIKRIISIEDEITKEQDIWRPRELTKESLIERINVLLGKNNNLIHYISSVDFYRLIYNCNGSIRLNDELDLIITSKNNYYLVMKSCILGRGASKISYEGLDLSKGRTVAIKYLRDAVTADKVADEEDAYLKLGEKKGKNGIAKIIDYLKFENKCIFISKLYNGNLSLELKKNKLLQANSEKGKLCKKMTETVYSAIQKDVFWFDIKPDNFCLDDQGNPVFIDLSTKDFTLLYGAPELLPKFSKNEEEKSQSIIWSLGMTFYKVHCGKDLLLDFREKYYPNVKIIDKKRQRIDENIRWLISKLTDARIEELINKQIGLNPENKDFLQLIQSMLTIDPSKRVTWSQIMQSPAMGSIPEIPEEKDLQFIEALAQDKKVRRFTKEEIEKIDRQTVNFQRTFNFIPADDRKSYQLITESVIQN